MVNKVDGNNYYEYPKPKSVDIPSTGEKFSLGYNGNGLPTEAEDGEKDDAAAQKKLKEAEQGGVKLELSSGGFAAGTGGQRQSKEAKPSMALDTSSLIEMVRTFITTAIAAVKDFINKIWNDPQPEEVLQDSPDISVEEIMDAAAQEEGLDADVQAGMDAAAQEGIDVVISEGLNTVLQGNASAEKTESVPVRDEKELERQIQQYLRKGDVEQAIKLLTDNGRRTVARNSTLMTSYDKNGKVVEPKMPVWEKNLYKNPQKTNSRKK